MNTTHDETSTSTASTKGATPMTVTTTMTTTAMAAATVAVDVVSPGKGLVTHSEFSGTILRDRQRGTGYLVEDEWDRVVGRARSYHDGALLLARHHGATVARVEVEHEHRDYPRGRA